MPIVSLNCNRRSHFVDCNADDGSTSLGMCLFVRIRAFTSCKPALPGGQQIKRPTSQTPISLFILPVYTRCLISSPHPQTHIYLHLLSLSHTDLRAQPPTGAVVLGIDLARIICCHAVRSNNQPTRCDPKFPSATPV